MFFYDKILYTKIILSKSERRDLQGDNWKKLYKDFELFSLFNPSAEKGAIVFNLQTGKIIDTCENINLEIKPGEGAVFFDIKQQQNEVRVTAITGNTINKQSRSKKDLAKIKEYIKIVNYLLTMKY